MAEEKKNEHGFIGETIIGDEVVASIAGMAAQEIPGVGSLGRSAVRRALTGAFADAAEKARTGVSVEVGKRECIVALQINVMYGHSIPNIINEVRKKVASRLLEFTGLIAKEINIRVVGIDVAASKPQSKVQ
ncbi:MAG: Asp23/Gls24 family envelope stress response protein [Dehalococcoidia bacterium]|nr:MAG: Asp23/Gls24 family envelope stress response protein [Dehalococcoidia bacterium]